MAWKAMCGPLWQGIKTSDVVFLEVVIAIIVLITKERSTSLMIKTIMQNRFIFQ